MQNRKQYARSVTARQTAVAEFIRSYTAGRGYPPTIRDIGHGLGIVSVNGVVAHLKALERKGIIVRDPLKARGVRMAKQGGAS